MISPALRTTTAAVLLAAAGLAGCGSSGHPAAASAAFDDQANTPVTCMAHQTRAPTAAYHPGKGENVTAVLAVMRYYTSNGGRAYCDGRPATATDLAWMRLYVAGGATAGHVARWLPS